MARSTLTATGAIFWGGLIAGVLDIAAVVAFWAARDVSPISILQSIATSVIGAAAFEGGYATAGLGLFLHFFVSFVFAAGYVIVSSRLTMLRARPVIFGILYGVVAYIIMTKIVVPLSLATFGKEPPPLLNLMVSISIHLFLFGLPIALVASRIKPKAA